MIHEGSVAAVNGSRLNDRFVKPLYDTFGFAQIPQFVRAALGAGDRMSMPFDMPADLVQANDRVVLFFVDAFGWRFFNRHLDRSPFLRRMADEGTVFKLTSQFPSTTAAHVTTIHTGMPVGQHGVHEWFYYEPQLDALIAPLLFSFAGDKQRDTLAQTGVTPAMLYPQQNIYHDLQQHGVESYIFQHQSYAASPFTRLVTNGATTVPYRTLPQALATLGLLFERQQRPSYYFVYVDTIDALGHQYGPESPHFLAESEAFLLIMEHLFHRQLSRAPGRTLFMMTADHGQVAIDPATAIYLNLRFPQIIPWLKTSAAGRPLAPAGSNRDMFLYIRDAHVEEAQAFLAQALAGRAEVYRTADLIAQGFFGSQPPSERFLSRVGNLVILPYAGESVWWYEKDVFEQNFYGNHGGLTPEEMETILLVQQYG
jgi:predicted AlkP superfamily pyrophosphatase or phosphodiesterase